MISPGRLLDVARGMLAKVLKWRSCCSVFVDLEQMIDAMLDRCVAHRPMSAGDGPRIFSL